MNLSLFLHFERYRHPSKPETSVTRHYQGAS